LSTFGGGGDTLNRVSGGQIYSNPTPTPLFWAAASGENRCTKAHLRQLPNFTQNSSRRPHLVFAKGRQSAKWRIKPHSSKLEKEKQLTILITEKTFDLNLPPFHSFNSNENFT